MLTRADWERMLNESSDIEPWWWDLATWLQDEEVDPHAAAALRWMIRQGHKPIKRGGDWCWTTAASFERNWGLLPSIGAALQGGKVFERRRGCRDYAYPTRAEAVFALLPAVIRVLPPPASLAGVTPRCERESGQ